MVSLSAGSGVAKAACTKGDMRGPESGPHMARAISKGSNSSETSDDAGRAARSGAFRGAASANVPTADNSAALVKIRPLMIHLSAAHMWWISESAAAPLSSATFRQLLLRRLLFAHGL